MRYKSPSFSFAIAASLLVLGVASPAAALDPEDADLISAVTLDVPAPYDIDDDDVTYLGIAECERMIRNDAQISATFDAEFNPSNDDGDIFEEASYFQVNRGSTARIACGTDNCTFVDMNDLDFTETTISFELPFTEITGLTEESECTGFDHEYFFRVNVRTAIGADTFENADGKMVIDTIRPSAPSGLEASATENTINVSFDGVEDSDLARYTVFWSKSGFDGGSIPDTETLKSAPLGTETSGDVVADLDPTGTVFIAVASRDEAGNFSALSGAVEVSVVETNDFWETYRSAGGAERGGCSTAAGNAAATWPLALLGLFAFGPRRRRTRWLAAAVVATGLLAAPIAASAETPTYGAFGLKLGTYYPAIDDEFGGSGPFADVFGTKNLLMGEIEGIGWIYQGIGKAGLGGSWGFSKVKGNAVVVDEEADVEETTTFGVMPFRAFATYRMDWLAQHTKIPLSAAVKGGLDFYRWRIADAAGDTATFDGDTASGWKRGYHYGFELQLLLDFIQPAAAAAMDLNWGVNNSYFAVEYLATRVDNFGEAGFDLSDNIWLFGLNFEF